MSAKRREKTYNALSEEKLIHLWKTGDKSALGELVTRYNRYAAKAVYNILRNSSRTEDIIQEAALKADKSAHTFRLGNAFRNWFVRIAVNLAFNEQRRTKKRPKKEPLYEGSTATAGNGEDIITKLVRREDNEIIWKAIHALPEKQRIVISLKCVNAFTYDKIADKLNEKVSTVKSRFYAARQTLIVKLRSILKEKGIQCHTRKPKS